VVDLTPQFTPTGREFWYRERFPGVEYSEIGVWSEAKLNIVAKYAKAYSTILSKKEMLTHIYVDAFAGPGLHRAKISGRPGDGRALLGSSASQLWARNLSSGRAWCFRAHGWEATYLRHPTPIHQGGYLSSTTTCRSPRSNKGGSSTAILAL
jgi:hypothetical protein